MTDHGRYRLRAFWLGWIVSHFNGDKSNGAAPNYHQKLKQKQQKSRKKSSKGFRL